MSSVGSYWGQSRESLIVTATSAVNGLAFDAHQTWAFWRAQATGIVQTPFRDRKGDPLTMVPVRTLPPTLMGDARLVEHLRVVFSGCQRALQRLGPDVRLAVVLCLPEPLGDDQRAGPRATLTREARTLCERHGLRRSVVVSFATGHGALAEAVLDVQATMNRREIEAALVIGVDGYWDAGLVDRLLSQERLFDLENLDSFIPGEGAAALLLTSPETARSVRLPALAVIEGAVHADEPGHLWSELPCTGQGLAEPLRALATALAVQGRLVEWMFGDVTNEHHRTNELQLALPRAFAPGGLDDAGRSFLLRAVDRPRIDFVPERFGDLGAATMPTAVVIATEAFRRGSPSHPTCLVWGSSVGPRRGVVLVSAP